MCHGDVVYLSTQIILDMLCTLTLVNKTVQFESQQFNLLNPSDTESTVDDSVLI